MKLASTRHQRGMVTAELAFASLAAMLLLVLCAWVLSLVMLLTKCQDTAAEVARQEARGDTTAVARSKADRPPGATVSVTHRAREVTVRVDLRARPWAAWLPVVPLSATATVLTEEG